MTYTWPQVTLIGTTSDVVAGTHKVTANSTMEFIVEPPAAILFYDDQTSLESEW